MVSLSGAGLNIAYIVRTALVHSISGHFIFVDVIDDCAGIISGLSKDIN